MQFHLIFPYFLYLSKAIQENITELNGFIISKYKEHKRSMSAHVKIIKYVFYQGVLRHQTLKQESKILWQVMSTSLLSDILLTLLWKTQLVLQPCKSLKNSNLSKVSKSF